MSYENDASQWQAYKLRSRFQREDVVFAQFPRKDGTFPTDKNENSVLIKGADRVPKVAKGEEWPDVSCMRIFLPSLDACHALQLFFEPEQSPHKKIANLVNFAKKAEALDMSPLELFQRLTGTLSAMPRAVKPSLKIIQEALTSVERGDAATAEFDRLASLDWLDIIPASKSGSRAGAAPTGRR